MKFKLQWCLCIFGLFVISVKSDGGSINTRRRESRKLFGGYRITPKVCKPTRTTSANYKDGGPNVCMFNHECIQRNGLVVGACMDGFLFGACCQLPLGSVIGDYLGNSDEDLISVSSVDGNHVPLRIPATPKPSFGITSSALSQITASLLNGENNILPTAQDNEVIQINSEQGLFSTTGVTHPDGPDTIILNQQDNEINPNVFYKPTTPSILEDKKTTMRSSSQPTLIADVSVPGGNIGSYTPVPILQRPMFRPKPTQDNYVLVPTINHDIVKPNKTQEYDSIVNIINMLNQSSTTFKPSTSYVFSTTILTKRPSLTKVTTTSKPPSTSYIFSSTLPPKRIPSTTPTSVTTTKKKTKPSSKKPTKNTNKKTTQTSQKPPSPSYVYSSTFRPTAHSTIANSPEAFVTASTLYGSSTTTKPPSTSYVYSSFTPTRRPPSSTVNTHVSGPSFSVTSAPTMFSSQYSPYPSAAPTLIVLAPVSDDIEIASEDAAVEEASALPQRPSTTTYRPQQQSTALPPRKPVNHVVVNNHVTQNIYSTSRPHLEQPSPTVLITPKPTISSTSTTPEAEIDGDSIVVTATDDLMNFPPVRNPNLNMSVPILGDDDITTPSFIEDEALNSNIESFVNQIIIGLQEPFQGLKDVVYNKNTSAALDLISTTASSTTLAPTKKPAKKQGTTTKKPTTKRPLATTNSIRTTRKPTTRRPAATNSPTRKQTTTTKKIPTVVTKKPLTTTTPNLIETQGTDDNDLTISQDYREQCGVRPLVRAGRIVGGKGATFGEFPWQVLVRESTWLGLFTKNKCGGVLISDKYVMTAAHCQPGFLASLVAVFGEFDISGDLETKKPISRNVKRVIVHRKYDAATFENDLALLELESPVTFDAHIIPICLPRENEDFTGRMATVTGWGRLKYGGGVPSVLQEVQVPIMENHVCQEMFRTAGHSKVILESFLCAGYANGQKDSCEGDSGGPLVLQRPDSRYQLAGTVSHGIKCAAPYLPGVYMRTTYFKPWITSITGIQ